MKMSRQDRRGGIRKAERGGEKGKMRHKDIKRWSGKKKIGEER